MSTAARNRTKLWIYRMLAMAWMVINLWSIVTVFWEGIRYRKVINGYSLFSSTDGTAGVVMANGSLSYTPDFSRVFREYSMTGNGFFRVEHTDKLFLLHYAGGLDIRSYGGAFEVGAVPGDKNKLRVLVGEENVELTDLSGNSYGRFSEREEVTIDLVTKQVTRKRYNKVFVSDQNVRPVLRFERMKIADVAPQLEDLFEVDFRVDASVADYLVDATFPADVSLVDVLGMLTTINSDKGVIYKIVRDREGKIGYVTVYRQNTVSTTSVN